ncbi:hypothetical protein COOONC_03954 [Cooperia oncophora]
MDHKDRSLQLLRAVGTVLSVHTPRFVSCAPAVASSPFTPTMSKPIASGARLCTPSSRRHDALYYYFHGSQLLFGIMPYAELKNGVCKPRAWSDGHSWHSGS